MSGPRRVSLGGMIALCGEFTLRAPTRTLLRNSRRGFRGPDLFRADPTAVDLSSAVRRSRCSERYLGALLLQALRPKAPAPAPIKAPKRPHTEVWGKK